MPINITRIRVITYVNLVLLFIYLVFTCYATFVGLSSQITVSNIFLTNYLILACLGTHTGLIFYIHSKLYPNKEITRALKTWTIVFAVISGILLVLFILAIIGLLVVLGLNESEDMNQLPYILGIIWMVSIVVFMMLQIGSGNRLMRYIENNYRHELENSIA
jgi:hypothetical protein